MTDPSRELGQEAAPTSGRPWSRRDERAKAVSEWSMGLCIGFGIVLIVVAKAHIWEMRTLFYVWAPTPIATVGVVLWCAAARALGYLAPAEAEPVRERPQTIRRQPSAIVVSDIAAADDRPVEPAPPAAPGRQPVRSYVVDVGAGRKVRYRVSDDDRRTSSGIKRS